jgi:hypothetical protein
MSQDKAPPPLFQEETIHSFGLEQERVQVNITT